MNIEAFTPDHFRRLLLQPSQAVMQPMLADPSYADMLHKAGPAYAAVDGDVVIACLGVIPQWEGRAIAWGLVGRNAGRNMLAIHRGVSRFLELCEHRRVETSVATNFDEGHRWARLLGFTREGTMSAYAPGGYDCDLYARIR
jgi:hypothetical protein